METAGWPEARHIAEFFERDRFARENGIRVVEVRLGFARTEMTVEPRHLNSVGILQGGALFTLADLAFAVASNSSRGRGGRQPGRCHLVQGGPVRQADGCGRGDFPHAQALDMSDPRYGRRRGIGGALQGHCLHQSHAPGRRSWALSRRITIRATVRGPVCPGLYLASQPAAGPFQTRLW